MLFLLGVAGQRGRLPRPVVAKRRRCSSCSAWSGSAGGCLVRLWPSGVDALLNEALGGGELCPLLHRLVLVELERKRVLVLNEALGFGELCPLLHRIVLYDLTQLGAA